MSDRSHPDDLIVDLALRDGLRRLPLSAPSASAWPELQRALLAQKIIVEKSRKPGRQVWTAALAAGLLLAALWLPSHRPAPDESLAPGMPTTASVKIATAPTLASLRDESQRIESWLRQLSAGGATLSGQDLMAAAEVEDLIGMIDLQLGATATDSDDSASLWKQRVELLHDLAAIRATNYSLAITDMDANGIAPASRNWIN